MTKDELIQEVIDEVTVSGMIQVPLTPKEIERNIRTTCRWMYDNYSGAVETSYIILDIKNFRTPTFKATRKVHLPECVHTIWGCEEMKGFTSMGNPDKDFSQDRLIASEIYVSAAHGDGLVMRTAQSMYHDLAKAFNLTHIAFNFSNNTNDLIIMGRDPRHDVLLKAYNKIPVDKLAEDYYFQRFVICLSKISVARALGYVNMKLLGGHEINSDNMKTEAEEELKEIKEKIDSENTPDWFFVFH